MQSCGALGAEAKGAAFMAVAGLMQTMLAALSLWMKRAEWPFYRIQCVSVAALGFALLTYLAVAITLGLVILPRWHLAKWVFLRGACTGLRSLLSLVAVQLGAPLGDVAALGSINTVAAALLGRLFLGEALRSECANYSPTPIPTIPTLGSGSAFMPPWPSQEGVYTGPGPRIGLARIGVGV